MYGMKEYLLREMEAKAVHMLRG
uniref:Uncharacterized protein n=1 Tax=Arundo donax TaxID=35708 RepID=A0A0A9QB81_ARUDO